MPQIPSDTHRARESSRIRRPGRRDQLKREVASTGSLVLTTVVVVVLGYSVLSWIW